jgi:ribulose-5-phosphate 4-epimerase/fuculose-1-phosphate aldolase
MTAAAPDLVHAARSDLAAAYRWAVRLGLSEGIDNHFTVVVPGSSDRFFVNEFGLHWSEVRAGNLLMVDFRGALLEGVGSPDPTAFHIHSCIHRRIPEARCILHTHMPYATALTALENGRLEMCVQTSLLLHDLVAYDDDYCGLALDEVEGERMARILGSKRVLFLGNHGVVVTGRSVEDAFDLLYYLERACQVQVLAMSTGRKLRLIPNDTVQHTLAQLKGASVTKTHFAALKRMLHRLEPDFDS